MGEAMIGIGVFLFGLGCLAFGFSRVIPIIERETQQPTTALSAGTSKTSAQDQGSRSEASATRTPDFELVQLGTFRRDQFLIDRRSGRVWQSVCTGKSSGPDCNGLMIWHEMSVAGLTPPDSEAAKSYRSQVLNEIITTPPEELRNLAGIPDRK